MTSWNENEMDDKNSPSTCNKLNKTKDRTKLNFYSIGDKTMKGPWFVELQFF